MKEYFTKALVMGQENSGETDRRIFLYTEELGKVVARARGARKIISKLAGHLEPATFSDVRLIEKNGLQVADALSFGKMNKNNGNMRFLQFLKEMTFEFQPDRRLWSFIKKNFLQDKKADSIPYREILKIMGFDPKFAECQICQSQNVNCFSETEQIFLCEHCSSKVPQNEIILI